MINKTLHANIVSAILSDPMDRTFISTVRNFIDKIPQPNEDEEITSKILKSIVKENITSKDEILYLIASEDYSDKIESNIKYDSQYSKSYKESLISKLNMDSTLSKFKPYQNKMTELMDIMETHGANGKGEAALKELLEMTGTMHKVSQDISLGAGRSNRVIFDPASLGLGGSPQFMMLAKQMVMSVKNRVKTIPVVDNMWGGGAIPGSLYLTAGISGNGKSLFMQNLALYACKNNKPEDFELDGLKPCVVFFSYEMDFRQCMERTFSWLGLPVPTINEGENIVDYSIRLDKSLAAGFEKMGMQIPIFYITEDTDSGEALPDASSIEREIDRIRGDGFHPIYIVVDYLDRMDIRNKRLKLGESGGEGAAKIRLKAREMRDVAKRRNSAILTATQLDGEAMAKNERMEPFQKKFDIILEFGMNNIAGSKNLRSEVEDVILVNVFNIEVKDSDTDTKKTSTFISIKQEKDRDNKKIYKLSTRDKNTLHQYNSYTQMLKNSASRDMLKLTTRYHAVIPMIQFRLSEDDYGMSIRIFYPSDNADFVSVSDLISNSMTKVSDDEVNDMMEQMFDPDYLSEEELDAIKS